MIIGIYGNIGTGKTTLAKYLSKKSNYILLNVDLIAKNLLKQKNIKKEINFIFPNILNEKNEIKNFYLKNKIFNSLKNNWKFNNWFTPILTNEINRQINIINNKNIIIDCAILNLLKIKKINYLIYLKSKKNKIIKRLKKNIQN